MKKYKIGIIVLSTILLTGCSDLKLCKDTSYTEIVKEDTIDFNEDNYKEDKVEIIEEEPEIYQVSLMAIGDDLIHSPVYKAAKISEDSYNFDSLFANISEDLNNSDIKVINQETIMINDRNGYSGYPAFASPIEVGEAINKAGFNVVLHATNHSFDQNLKGITDTLDFWKQYSNINVVGLHDSQEDADKIKVMEVNNIKIALLNYTYGLNGFVLPSDKKYLVDTLEDRENVVNDIKSAKEEADVVIVFPHWGIEYKHNESDEQTELAELMAESGADIIIGTHPHVVEPLKYIYTTDGREVPVYYSLGNFVSNQSEIDRMLGAMAKISITKEEELITINSTIEPLITHRSKGEAFTVYKLDNYTDELGSINKTPMNTEELYNLWDSIVNVDEKEKTLSISVSGNN